MENKDFLEGVERGKEMIEGKFGLEFWTKKDATDLQEVLDRREAEALNNLESEETLWPKEFYMGQIHYINIYREKHDIPRGERGQSLPKATSD